MSQREYVTYAWGTDSDDFNLVNHNMAPAHQDNGQSTLDMLAISISSTWSADGLVTCTMYKLINHQTFYTTAALSNPNYKT